MDDRQLAGRRQATASAGTAATTTATSCPTAIYRMRVVRRDEGRVIDSVKEIRVDTPPPRVPLLSAKPSVIAPRAPGQSPGGHDPLSAARANRAPEFRVFRTDDAAKPHVVRRFRGKGRSGVWHGEVATGAERTGPAPDGDYAFTVSVRDKAGNLAVAPAPIPRAGLARPGHRRVGAHASR